MKRSRKRRRGPPEERSLRNQRIRDAALATGQTCIACGADAVARVGPYPVCARHQDTVRAPDPLQPWKDNVRGRHARLRMRACRRCGRRGNLTRHHDWTAGEPGRPPKPVVLCRKCHVEAERPSLSAPTDRHDGFTLARSGDTRT